MKTKIRINPDEAKRLVKIGISRGWIKPAPPQPAEPVMGRPRNVKEVA